MFLFTLFRFSTFFIWFTVSFILRTTTNLASIFRIGSFSFVIADEILTVVTWCIDWIHHFVFIVRFSITLIITNRLINSFSIHFTIISFTNSTIPCVYFIRLFSLLLYFSLFCLLGVLRVLILTRVRFRDVTIVRLIWAFWRYTSLIILAQILIGLTYIF